MRWLQEKTWKSHSIQESSFIYPQKEFKNNPIRGLEYIKERIVPFLGGGKTIVNSECIYQYDKKLDLLKNSKLLVIGGGPSTLEMGYDIEEYDYVFSCNHFFKNERLKKEKMFMVFLGDEIDLDDKDLVDYLTFSQETLVCFENIGSPPSKKKFKDRYLDRVLWAHTRYHSKIGAMTRIVSYLCNFSPKEISIVGMDGPILKKEQNVYYHAFEKYKEQTGTIESTMTEERKIQKYKNQYLEFWDYILHDIGSSISFRNLGHGHKCNLTTKILSDRMGSEYQDYLFHPEKRK